MAREHLRLKRKFVPSPHPGPVAVVPLMPTRAFRNNFALFDEIINVGNIKFGLIVFIDILFTAIEHLNKALCSTNHSRAF